MTDEELSEVFKAADICIRQVADVKHFIAAVRSRELKQDVKLALLLAALEQEIEAIASVANGVRSALDKVRNPDSPVEQA